MQLLDPDFLDDRNLPDVLRRKLVRKKLLDGFSGKPWIDWLKWLVKDIYLEDSIQETIQRSTKDNLLKTWCQNLAANLPDILVGKSIAALVPEAARDAPHELLCPTQGPAVVVGRGPSLFKHKHLELLAKHCDSHGKWPKGMIIASDGALGECLDRGIFPDYVVTVDGNREKIWKWYDHPDLRWSARPPVSSILCCMVAHNVFEQCAAVQIPVYWFNPLFDDYRQNESFTRMQMHMTSTEASPNGLPSVTAGGNAGCTSWVLATTLFRRSPIALIGIDLGYLPEDPLSETYYWGAMMEATKGDAARAAQEFRRYYNPFFKTEVLVDYVFQGYKESWLGLLRMIRGDIRTVNCTEGGYLYSDEKEFPLEYMPFKQFLQEVDRTN